MFIYVFIYDVYYCQRQTLIFFIIKFYYFFTTILIENIEVWYIFKVDGSLRDCEWRKNHPQSRKLIRTKMENVLDDETKNSKFFFFFNSRPVDILIISSIWKRKYNNCNKWIIIN
jgi:hypothetical protein